MFVEACTFLSLPFVSATKALDHVLEDGGLVHESQLATDEGVAFLLRVGPRGARGFAKQVEVHVLPARRTPSHVVIPLRWKATGVSGWLFPSLDGDVELKSDCGGSTLSIVACYRPPLDSVGAGLDRAVMSQVARRTVEAFLAEVAARITAFVAAVGFSPGATAKAADG